MTDYCVYKHTAPSGKVYIGVTCQNPIARWQGGGGYKYNTHFYNAILKYGWDNFKHEILYTDLDKQEASKIEIDLISKYQSNNRDFGYNISPGGGLLTEEQAKKVSDAKKGKQFSDKHRLALSEAHKGKAWTESQRIARDKIQKFGADARNAKSVSRYTLDGKYIDTLPCTKMYDDVLQNPNAHKHICSACRGRRNSAYGFMWKYAAYEPVSDIQPVIHLGDCISVTQ